MPKTFADQLAEELAKTETTTANYDLSDFRENISYILSPEWTKDHQHEWQAGYGRNSQGQEVYTFKNFRKEKK